MNYSICAILGVWESLMHMITEKYPDLFVLVIVIVGTWCVFNLYSRLKAVEIQGNKTEAKLDQLILEFQSFRASVEMTFVRIESKFTAIDVKFAAIDTRFAGIEKRLDELSNTVDLMARCLISITGVDLRSFSSKSPLSLTESGFEILEKSGGRAYVDKILPDLLKRVEDKSPRTALDVHNYCYSVLMSGINDNDFIPMKEWVFENPTLPGSRGPVPVFVEHIVFMMTIYLRGKFLERHQVFRLTSSGRVLEI